jgi:hypothetical protein
MGKLPAKYKIIMTAQRKYIILKFVVGKKTRFFSLIICKGQKQE